MFACDFANGVGMLHDSMDMLKSGACVGTRVNLLKIYPCMSDVDVFVALRVVE
jgi:hypothetical protein